MALRGFDALVARRDEDLETEVPNEAPDEAVAPVPPIPLPDPAEIAPPAGPALVPFDAPFEDDAPPPVPLIKSEIPRVTDEQWTEFVRAMRTAQTGSISATSQLGAFEMRPRRLEDLGLMKKVRACRSPQGVLAWVGDWVKPLTQERFLSSPRAQYLAFAASMRRYVEGLRDGSIQRPNGGLDKDMTLSGVLAILHRCGPQGLASWNDPEKRFDNTLEIVSKANGIF